jgi:RHS repeat-associated protein
MKKIIYTLIIAFFCVATQPKLQAQTTVVGSIPGKFNVGSSGAATYSIPIECPAGINGIQPNISLVYNSQGGSGPLGMGWSINGLSVISRTSENLFSDNKISGSILYNDLFSLDGNKLHILNNTTFPSYQGYYSNITGKGTYPQDYTSGSINTPGSTYETEYKTYNKIETFGSIYDNTSEQDLCGLHGKDISICERTNWSANSGDPNKFKVTTKDGKIIEYAQRFLPVGSDKRALYWLISKIIDANGNYMTFSYQIQSGQIVIQRIDYTGNGTNGAYASLVFNYENKSVINKSYIEGSYIEDRFLLKNIQVKSNTTLNRQYNLEYDYHKEKYFLRNVELVGQNNQKLNSTVIEWGQDNTNINVSTMPVIDNSIDNNQTSWSSVDVNGDGLTDLVCFSQSYLKTYISSLDALGKPKFTLKNSEYVDGIEGVTNGSIFSPAKTIFGNPPYSFADFNGNGNKLSIYMKYIGGPANTFKYMIQGQPSYMGKDQQIGTSVPAFCIADINNDGIDEIVTVEKGLSNGQTYANIRYSKNTTTYSWKTVALNISEVPKDILIEDFNGDGLKDLLIITANYYYIYMNNGGAEDADGYIPISFSNIATSNDFNSNYSVIRTGDFNGDGLVDFILNEHCNSNWKLAINNGKWGFNITPLSNFTAIEESFTTNNDDKEDCIVTDFNNDGKSDIILIDPVYSSGSGNPYIQTNITWYASTGTGFNIEKTFTTTDANYTFNRFNTTGDFDGDGREELFTYGSDLYNGGVKSDHVFISGTFNTNFEANRITQITDGMGKTTGISYQPLTYTTTPDNKTFYTKGTTATYPVADIQMPLYCVSKVSEPNGQGGLSTSEFAYSEAQAQLTGRGFLGFKSQTISNSTINRKIILTTDLNTAYCLPNKETTEVSTLDGIAVSKTENSYANTKTNNIYETKPSQTVEHDYLNDLMKTTDYVSFDSYGNPTQIKTNQGDVTSRQTISYIQKGSFCPNKPEVITVTNKQGSDSIVRTKSCAYDEKGNLTQKITDVGDANELTINNKDLTIYGQPTKTETTANGITRSESIAIGTSGRFMESKIDVLGQTTSYNWDATRGLLNSETNRLGTTSYTYNGLGQLTRTDYADGTYKETASQWASPGNAFGALFYVTQAASGTLPSTSWFDAMQRPIVAEAYGLNGNVSRVFTQYRADGKTDRVSAPTFGNEPTVWDAVYDYYTEGRLKTVVTPTGTSTTTYNDKTTTVSTPDGTQTSVLNTAGQVNASTVNGKTVTYTYYPSGKTKTATPDDGKAVAMEYDLQGNRIKLTDPDMGISKAFYNGYGELKSDTIVNNSTQGPIISTYTYNNITGLLEARVRNGETTTYGYDTNKRLETVEIAGQHKQTYAYGDYDRISTLTELINGSKTLVKQYGYDTNGRVNKETFPSGYYVENHYDTYGNLYQVTDNHTPARVIWQATEANARGQLTKLLKGTKETVYGYDETKAQLTSIIAAGVINYGYNYDAKNNPEYRTDSLNKQKEHFTYDTQNRLTNWDILNNTTNAVLKPNSITYDGTTGNITTKSDLNVPNAVTLNYEKTSNPHALTTISPVSNVISPNEMAVTYTDFRKIKTLNENGNSYAITYGVDDQRRMSVYSVGSTRELTKYYMGDYEEEVVGTNIRKIHYLRGAIYIQNNGSDSLLYSYTDNQGSLIALTDESGTIKRKYAYDPWGARRNPADWTQKDNGSNLIINRGYTGHEHLDAFGIINMNGRVYDPLTAQFYSPDPFISSAGNWLGYNRYAYVMNNPLQYTDPSGYIPAPNESESYFQLNIGGSHRINSDPYGIHNNTYFGNAYGNYFDWNGNSVPFSEVQTNFIQPNLSPASGDQIITALNTVQSVYKFYSVQFASGYTSYAESIGDIGNATVSSNGGLSFSNPTAGTTSLSLWSKGGSGGIGSVLEYAGKTNDFVDALAKSMGTNGLTSAMVNDGKAIGRYAGPAGVVISAGQVYIGYRKDGNHFGYNAQKATAGAVGGIAGAWVGFRVGAWAGFEAGFSIGLAFEGVGAIPGGVIGGIIGGFGGAWGGAYGGSKLGESLIHK